MPAFRKILNHVWPQMRKYRLAFFLVFASYGLATLLDNILKPYLYKNIIDALANATAPDLVLKKILTLAIIIAGTILLHQVFYRIGDYANAYFESKTMKGLYDYTFDKLLHHSYAFFSNSFSGSIVAKTKRFSRAFEMMQDVLSYQIWFSTVNITAILLVLIWQAPILGVVFFVWAIIYIGITLFFTKRKIEYDTRKAAADSVVTAKLSDALTNILNIKIFSSGLKERARFQAATTEEEIRRRKSWQFGNFQNVFQSLLMGILQVVVLFLNIHLWRSGQITVGTFVLVQTYMMSIFDILWNLGRSMSKFAEAFSDMKEVVAILDLKPDIMDTSTPEECRISKGQIKFDDVTFQYIEGHSVFSNFNLSIAPGEKIGLVGYSGSGKSTITKLLLRFADIKAGRILIDGQDISKIKQDDLRAKISYVPQEPILFHRTIKENISYSKENSTDDEVVAVARKAHAHEFISDLMAGYDTLVGERGIKLSGGERQRIAIARAMLKDAPILVLDEATSSLDSVSEHYIQDAFQELMKGKTTIVIAHRLSTVQKMDRIIVLDKGRVVEQGTHSELLAKNGFYKELWERQTGGFLK